MSESPRGAASQRRLVLHIGMPKTGTTTLQRALAKLHDTAAGSGICYPLEVGQFNQILPSLDLLSSDPAFWERQTPRRSRHAASMSPRVRGQWERACSAVNAAEGDSVLSAENLVFAGELTRDRLRTAFGGHDVTILITYRNAPDLLASYYSQSCLIEAMPEFDAWVRWVIGSLLARDVGSSVHWVDRKGLADSWRSAGFDAVHLVDPLAREDGFDAVWSELPGDAPMPDLLPQNTRRSFVATEAMRRFLTLRPNVTAVEARWIYRLAESGGRFDDIPGGHRLRGIAADLLRQALDATGDASTTSQLAELIVSPEPISQVPTEEAALDAMEASIHALIGEYDSLLPTARRRARLDRARMSFGGRASRLLRR